MQQEENKKVDTDLNGKDRIYWLRIEHYIENTLLGKSAGNYLPLDDDYLIALQLQQEFDKQGNTESEVNSSCFETLY